MARKARFVVPGCPLHVIQRGNNRQATFFHSLDYCYYLRCLCEAAERHCCSVHAYVLMTNHVHLLVTPDHAQAVSQMMRTVGRRYVLIPIDQRISSIACLRSYTVGVISA